MTFELATFPKHRTTQANDVPVRHRRIGVEESPVVQIWSAPDQAFLEQLQSNGSRSGHAASGPGAAFLRC
jgi:hypothetical protein